MKRLRNLSTPSHDLFPGFQRKRNRPEYVAINCRFDYFRYKKKLGGGYNSQNGTLGLRPFHLVLALVGAGFGFVHFARSDVPHQVEKHLQRRIKRSSNKATAEPIGLSHLVNVFAGLGRCFNVRDAPLLRAVLSLLQRHLSSLAQIAFIAHQQERNIFVVLHSENLFPGRERNPVSIRTHRISSAAHLNSCVAWKLSSSVMEKTQRNPSPLRK